MGVYYKLVCDERRESIDPGSINDHGIKLGAITNLAHPLGAIAMFLIGGGASPRYGWPNCRLVGDEGDADAYDNYRDITEGVIAAYNDYKKNVLGSLPLVFTGKETWK